MARSDVKADDFIDEPFSIVENIERRSITVNVFAENRSADFGRLGPGPRELVMSITTDHLHRLAEPTRVYRDIYVEPAIFDLEMERIFGRAWILIGHESQVPNPGDYFTTIVGRQPVIMVRQADGSIRVLYNRCGHRGVKVVNEPSGNAKLLRCMFHGWTFHADGRLAGATQPKGYPEGFPIDPVACGMPRVHRVESYHGFFLEYFYLKWVVLF